MPWSCIEMLMICITTECSGLLTEEHIISQHRISLDTNQCEQQNKHRLGQHGAYPPYVLLIDSPETAIPTVSDKKVNS